MTDSVATTLEAAAIPSLVVALQAAQQFIADLGTDPAQVALKFPGASQRLLGTLELQLPALASSEFVAAQTAVTSALANKITQLQAKLPKS